MTLGFLDLWPIQKKVIHKKEDDTKIPVEHMHVPLLDLCQDVEKNDGIEKQSTSSNPKNEIHNSQTITNLAKNQ